MLKTIIGTKIGMTQIFDAIGNLIPVTVVQAGPCLVTNIKTKDRDGYTAVQYGYGTIAEKKLNKPQMGYFKKLNLAPKKHLREFRTDDVASYQLGQEIKVDVFKPGDYVDVTGTSKGKGFAGGVKRHNFKGGPTTHGQSDRLRAPGSIGAQGPQRVLPGTRMAGHLGDETITIQKMKIVSVDPEKNLLLVEGAVPGVNRGIVIIKNTSKTVKVHVAAAKHADKKKSGAEKKDAAAPKKK